jgi:PKD repeat protein
VDEAWTGTNVFANTLGTSYPAPMATEYLVTGKLDCSALSTVYLRFWRWLEIADSTLATVEVSNDGSSWTTIWETDGVSYFWDDQWVECVYDISSVAAGQATVYVRWGIGASSTCSCAGWAIDDVEIWDGVPEAPVFPQTIYFFPLDSDPGWTTEGDWAFGIPAGVGGDPASPYSGLNVYGYNLSGAYPNDMPAYSLTTTPLNCTGFKDVTVSFQRWLGVERDVYDQALFQVSNDGSSWTTVWENDSSDLQDLSWVPVQYDISAVADGQPTVYLRWVMGPSDFMVTYSGWNIDDVRITGLPATEILAWVPYSDLGTEWPNTIAALDSQYTDYNLTETTTTDPATLESQLRGKHVFLVPEQESGTSADLLATGEAFSDVLRDFVTGGGTLVVTGEQQNWNGFLFGTGLMDPVYAAVYWSGEALPVYQPSHPLAEGLGATVTGVDATAAFSITYPGAAVVVGDGYGNAVVAARRIGAGAVVMMGFDYWSWDASAAQLLANAVRYPRRSTEVLLYDNNDPVLHVAKEALNRLDLPFTTCNDDTLDSELSSQFWNAAVVDCPNTKPTSGWAGLIGYINTDLGHVLLSTWNLVGETVLCDAFDAAAVEDVDGPVAIYDWNLGPPVFDFSQSVPSPLAGWQDVYWISDRTRLNATADGLALAGYAASPTADEAAIVMGNEARTLLDGFLWDDRDQDADGDGLQDVVEVVMNQIGMGVAVPMPNFSASATSGYSPLEVQFTDETRGNVQCRCWDFGDGTTSGPGDPADMVHTYAAPGLYTVSLGASNRNGLDWERKVDYIAVDVVPPPPVADFGATPTAGNAPLNVTFTDESTGVVSSWAWEFGDTGTSTLQDPTHVYASAGEYTVTLTVTGPGGSDPETKLNYITVGTGATANFSGTPTEGVTALTVAFTDLSTGDVLGWSWSFGDGGTSTVQNPSHEYTEPGKYTVTLVASDSYGSDSETKTKYIKVGFPDTPPDSFWAFDEVLDCVDAGVVAGYDDGLYHPDIQIDRALMATYTARALAGGDSSVPDGPPTPTFPDVDTGFWAYKYVEYAVSHHVVQGYDDGYYHPEILLDRGQMAVFIARSVAGDDASVPDGPATATFPDVDTGFWSYKHIEYCVDQGIVGGYPDGNYWPALPVTRDQMAVYVARALPLL